MSSTRAQRLARTGRVLLVAGVACGAGAAWWWLAADSVEDELVLDIEPAVAALPPTTIAPRPAADPPPTPSTVPPVAATETTAPTTIPLSPLAGVLGERGSAIPPDVEPRTRPTTLVIRDLKVLNPVRAVGLEDDGQLEVPDETEIGWYRYGAAPGTPGATVLAAHVTWNRTTGPFYRLGDIEVGEQVEVGLEDGTVRVYEVVERTMYDKDSLPRDRIWRTTGPESLVLITCGGSFNPEIRRYRQNIVVYAVPVEHRTTGATPA